MLSRRTTYFSIFAALIVGTFGTGMPAHPIAASGICPINARLVPEKTTFVLGEPVFASYIVRNASHRNVLMSMGGERFSFSAVRTDGLKAMPPPPNPYFDCCGGMSWQQELKAGASYAYERFLPDELPVTQPGTYTLTCRTVVNIQAADSSGIPDRRGASKSTSTQASVILTILPPDRARMGEIIARLGRTAVAGPNNTERWQPSGANRWQAADRAWQALCAIPDGRTVPWLIKMLRQPNSSRIEQALQALGRFDSASAFAAIRWGTHISASDVLGCATKKYALEAATQMRVDAANALATSPYPGALPCLWTLRHDPDPNVRHVVMDAAIAHRNACTTAILQEISHHDLYQPRRDKARAELKTRRVN